MNLETGPSPQTRFDRPPGWAWGTFENASGARLRYGYSEPAKGRRGRIVLLPGFREFGEKYYETIRDLLDLDYAVWQLDWYGQGGSDRHFVNSQKIGAASLESGVADLRGFVTGVLPSDPRTPVFLVAHSTGGLLVLRYLHDHPGTVTAAVMSAPLFAPYTGGVPMWLARGLVRLGVLLGLGTRYVPGAGDWRNKGHAALGNPRTTHDPERGSLQNHWMHAHPRLRMGGLTFGWLDAAFRLTAESTRASYLRAVSTPILIGSAGEDTLVRSDAHRRAAAFLPNAELVSFPRARHELFMEGDGVRDRWLAEIDRFLDAQISRREDRHRRPP
jgi:lysophospholipase